MGTTIHSVGNRDRGSRDQLIIHPTGRFSSLLLYDHKEKQPSRQIYTEWHWKLEARGWEKRDGKVTVVLITGPEWVFQFPVAMSLFPLSSLPGPSTAHLLVNATLGTGLPIYAETTSCNVGHVSILPISQPVISGGMSINCSPVIYYF